MLNGRSIFAFVISRHTILHIKQGDKQGMTLATLENK